MPRPPPPSAERAGVRSRGRARECTFRASEARWPARLTRERHEGIPPEHVVDLALHLLDLRVRPGLEPERQVRVRVRGADEPPATAGKDEARDLRRAPAEIGRAHV